MISARSVAWSSHPYQRWVLASIGALDDKGKPLPGVTVRVTRGQARKGGYQVTVTGPMPKRLTLPKPDPAP